MDNFDYAAPTSLDEAVGLLSSREDRVRFLAGGTDIIVQLREGGREDDLVLETGVMSYGGSETTISLPPTAAPDGSTAATPPPVVSSDATAVTESPPDFSAMTADERLAYHRRRLNSLLGP